MCAGKQDLNVITRLLACGLSFLLLLTPVFASNTAWQEIAPGANLRIIASDAVQNGKTSIALELQLAPGVQTYWRVPGETGVATQIDLSLNSVDLPSQIFWPYPIRTQKDGYVDHIYTDYLVLPVEFEPPSKGGQLDIGIFMGVCSDICVPVSAQFSLPLIDDMTDKGAALRIQQAKQLSPIAWDGNQDPVKAISFDATSKRLFVDFDPQAGDVDSLIATLDKSSMTFSAPIIEPGQGNIVSFNLLGTPPKQGLAGENLILTFMSVNGAYEIEKKL